MVVRAYNAAMRKLLAGAICATMLLTGYAVGTQTGKVTPPKSGAAAADLAEVWEDAVYRARDAAEGRELSDPDPDLAGALAAVAADPAASAAMADLWASHYLGAVARADGAAQISQVSDQAAVRFQALIVAQNARVIELLERIASGEQATR
jgi:hypothetical protein